MSYNEFRQGHEKVTRLHDEASAARLACTAQRRRFVDWLLSIADLLDPA